MLSSCKDVLFWLILLLLLCCFRFLVDIFVVFVVVKKSEMLNSLLMRTFGNSRDQYPTDSMQIHSQSERDANSKF